jgi:predicted nucleic acid-binding protein
MGPLLISSLRSSNTCISCIKPLPQWRITIFRKNSHQTAECGIETSQVTMLLSFLATRCILVSPQVEASILLQIHSNDKKDDKVLQCAIAGEADYLVTGDKKDLLLLNGQPQLGNTQIVSVKNFLSILGS